MVARSNRARRVTTSRLNSRELQQRCCKSFLSSWAFFLFDVIKVIILITFIKPMLNLSKYRLPFFFLIVLLVISATALTVIYNRGYRIDFYQKVLRPTGILAVSSSPAGAQVFIDGKLKIATNSTLSLSPDEYQVEIRKPDFSSWQKKITIEKEMVTQVEAFLFPRVPDLKPLTFDGAENPQISPDVSKIVYAIPSFNKIEPQNKAGLWVIDLNDSLFGLAHEPRQIAKNSKTLDFSKLNYFWSPDSRQILIDNQTSKENYLIDSNQFNQPLSIIDISDSLPKIIDDWQKENELRKQVKIKKLPEKMQEILWEKIGQFDFSPDGTKMVYVATASAEIPDKLIPPVFAASTQPQSRKIEPNKVYVYDLKEDKNFLIPFNPSAPTQSPTKKISANKKTPTPTPDFRQLLTLNPSTGSGQAFELLTIKWFPTSRHLYWISNDKVIACEYDGINTTTLYSGPFIKPFVFASPGANRFVILAKTNLDKENLKNLYSVSLR